MFRKMICVLLAATLCVSMNAYAAINETPIGASRNQILAERFFLRDYTIWDFNGNDITTAFYQLMTPAYQIHDYDLIANFIRTNVDRAEAFEYSDAMLLGESVLVTKYCFDWFLVDDLIHGREDHNAFSYEAKLRYKYDAEEDIITHGYAPDVYYYDLDSYYGNLPPEFDISNESYLVTADGSYIEYFFDFAAYIYVQSDDIAEANGWSYYYEGSVIIEQPAEP